MSELKVIKFRLTEEELASVKKSAEKYDMTVNALAKFMVLNLAQPATKVDRTFIKKLNGSIGKIGNNINQIARKINQSSSFNQVEKNLFLKNLFEIRNDTRKVAGKEELTQEEFKEESVAILRNKKNLPKE